MAASAPERPCGRHGDDSVRGDAAHTIRGEEQERRPLRLRGASETHPGGVGNEARAARRQPHLRHDEPEAGRQEHLPGAERILDAPGTHPEQACQIDSGLLRRLRIELIPQIDQRRVLTAARRSRQRRERDREAPRGAAPHQLDQTTLGKASRQQSVERRERRKERRNGRREGREIRRAQELRARAGEQDRARFFRKLFSFEKSLERQSLRNAHDEPRFPAEGGKRNLGVKRA